ncbi:methyltransferase [Trichoderma camerunense]
MAVTYPTSMRFIEPWARRGEIPFIRTNAPTGYDYMNFNWVEHDVNVTDARPMKQEFQLDQHGFAYRDDSEGGSPSMLQLLRNNNVDEVKAQYYPHVEKLIQEVTGASRVIIFDHTSRRRRPEMGAYENPTGKEQPATMVHCDQSTKGALRRLEQNVPGDLQDVLKKRVVMINVWRPLRGPVVDWPLATMDYRSCDPDLIYPTDLLDKADGYRGQTVTFGHSDKQKWYYLDGHRTDEVTLIKIWDNKNDVVGKLCPHAAFKHPNTPIEAPPRESVEVRCFAIFD